MRRLITFLIALLPVTYTAHAQDSTSTDIDEWQVLKAEHMKNPFAKSNQFSVNFYNYSNSEWFYPLPGAKVISPFGGARHHAGTDLKTKPNDPIYAAFEGEVILAGPHFGYGNTVVIRHANGLETLYSHQSKNAVKAGQWVKAGTLIGYTGRTGRATTEHLHFEVRVNGKAFDTSKFFDHPNHAIRRQKFTFTKKGNNITLSVEEPSANTCTVASQFDSPAKH